MSQRVDERVHTKDCLAVYTKALELTKYSMEVCKPKVKKDKDGKNRESNHHVPTRYSRIGDRIVDTLLDIGGIILEANEIYIGNNLKPEERIANLKRMKKKGIPIERIEEHYRCVRANMKKGSRSDLRKLDHYYKELFNEGN